MRRIKLARLLAGLSRKQAAPRAGMGVRTLAAWEDGEAAPSFSGVIKIAEIYGLPVDALAGEFVLGDLIGATRNHA